MKQTTWEPRYRELEGRLRALQDSRARAICVLKQYREFFELSEGEIELLQEAMRRLVRAIFGRDLADDEYTDVDAMCEWIEGLRAENQKIKDARDAAVAECQKRKGIELDELSKDEGEQSK